MYKYTVRVVWYHIDGNKSEFVDFASRSENPLRICKQWLKKYRPWGRALKTIIVTKVKI